MNKTALLTGLTGQDGSYLAELLLSKGYRVLGHVRPTQPGGSHREDLGSSNHLRHALEIHCFPENSEAAWQSLLAQAKPEEIYHLAASSSVRESWQSPLNVLHANTDLTTILLETIRRFSPQSKFFLACSSEIFGLPSESPQHEGTPVQPCTPYGVSKAAAHWMLRSYRQRYGLFLSSGILFNHESPRRPEKFVSRKITRGAVKIKLGLADSLELGNLSACRDWGFAGDFVDAMWRMLQLDSPEDFVLGTSLLVPTVQLVELAFAQLGLRWEDHVTINPALFRPNDPHTVVADIGKARRELGWSPQTTLSELIEMMIEADMDALGRSRHNGAAA